MRELGANASVFCHPSWYVRCLRPGSCTTLGKPHIEVQMGCQVTAARRNAAVSTARAYVETRLRATTYAARQFLPHSVPDIGQGEKVEQREKGGKPAIAGLRDQAASAREASRSARVRASTRLTHPSTVRPGVASDPGGRVAHIAAAAVGGGEAAGGGKRGEPMMAAHWKSRKRMQMRMRRLRRLRMQMGNA
ncbi:hypothetical protein BD414DRAFT_133050 [Trametes punicea]|nr:hypothetical protein BD414DRAFT_133050 [Trametes punicea]